MRARILTLAVLLLLAGCSSVPSLLYKIEIQQGNVITQEMVDKLKPGMTRSQVRFALGSPMINDAFHENRWDYLYRFEQRGKLIEQRKLTVFFEDDKLMRIDGSFSTPLAFVQHQPGESEERTEPTAPTAPTAPTGPLVEEIKEKSAGPILGEPSVSGGFPAQLGPSVASDVSVSGGVPSATATSDTPVSQRQSPREVPSPARDRGTEGADQLKE